MPHTPEFRQKFEEYSREKLQIKNLQDWAEFAKKWFPSVKWPRKTPQQLGCESQGKKGPIKLGGRVWSYETYAYDIKPEDRYEYIYTLKTIGDALRFPDEQISSKIASEGWRQECPFCEIETGEIGEDVCPLCGRKLVFKRYSD
jgi:hypothetical protein